jgi:IS30 family transposase
VSRYPRITPEDVARWDRLLTEGWSYKEIARTETRSHRTIAQYLPGRGWAHKQCVELGTAMKHHNQRMRKVSLTV